MLSARNSLAAVIQSAGRCGENPTRSWCDWLSSLSSGAAGRGQARRSEGLAVGRWDGVIKFGVFGSSVGRLHPAWHPHRSSQLASVPPLNLTGGAKEFFSQRRQQQQRYWRRFPSIPSLQLRSSVHKDGLSRRRSGPPASPLGPYISQRSQHPAGGIKRRLSTDSNAFN